MYNRYIEFYINNPNFMTITTLNQENTSIDTSLVDSEFGLMTRNELKNILENRAKEAHIFIKNSVILNSDKLSLLKKLKMWETSPLEEKDTNEIMNMIKDEAIDLIKYAEFLPIKKVRLIRLFIWKNYETISKNWELDFKLSKIEKTFKERISDEYKYWTRVLTRHKEGIFDN